MLLRDYQILRSQEYPPLKTAKSESRVQKFHINLRAEIEPAQRLRRKPPKLRRKNKGGAPKGNRNAFKNGMYAAPMKEMRRRVRACIVEAKRAIALANMESAIKEAKAAAMLRAARQACSPRPEAWPFGCDEMRSAPR